MCYWCRKLEKLHFQCLWGRFSDSQIWEADLWGRSVRPWEAVLLSLAQTDQRANQGSTASHGLPRPHRSASQIGLSDLGVQKSASQAHGLTTFLMWSVWANQGARPLRSVRPWESDRTLAGEAMRLAVKSVRQPRDRQHRPVCVGVQSDSSGRGNAFSREISKTAPRQTASPGVRERPIGLPRTLRSHDFVVRGRARPPTASHTASQIELSDRSDSLTDLTV